MSIRRFYYPNCSEPSSFKPALHPIATWASWELTSTLIDWLHSNIPGLEILPNYLRQRMLRRWHWWDNSRSQLWCGWKIHASPSCGRLDFVGSQLPINLEGSTLFSLPALRRHEDLLRFPTYFQAVLTHPAGWKQNRSDPSSWKHMIIEIVFDLWKMDKHTSFVPQLYGT